MTDQPEPLSAPAAPPAPPASDAPPASYAPPVAPRVVAWGRPVESAPRPRTMGLTAMIIAVAVFVLSFLASAIVGVNAGPLSERTATSFNFNTGALTPEQAAAFAPIGILMGAQLVLGTVLGILALVLGIIAVATKRGRAFGVIAIVFAGAAPIVSLVVYIGTLVATLPPA